jgi:hypothetical protein
VEPPRSPATVSGRRHVGIAAASVCWGDVNRSVSDSRPQFDHLILAVPDPESVRKVLADEWGLQVHPDGISFEDGLANLIVPLEPPEYLEILYVNDRDAFARTLDEELKRRVLGGGGLLGWGLRTWDIDAVARELGVEIDPGVTVADGSSAPWRTLDKPGSPLGFPFYIQYDASPEARMARWTQRLAEVQHRSRPGRTERVEVSGDAPELEAWLQPARHLDVRVLSGPPGLRAAVLVGDRVLTMSSDIPGGVVLDS